jgi:galactosyl transferase GMA12/MNN10 family
MNNAIILVVLAIISSAFVGVSSRRHERIHDRSSHHRHHERSNEGDATLYGDSLSAHRELMQKVLRCASDRNRIEGDEERLRAVLAGDHSKHADCSFKTAAVLDKSLASLEECVKDLSASHGADENLVRRSLSYVIIGANVGPTDTDHFWNRLKMEPMSAWRRIFYEPIPLLYAKLNANLKQQGMSDERTKTLQLAVSPNGAELENGVLTLFCPHFDRETGELPNSPAMRRFFNMHRRFAPWLPQICSRDLDHVLKHGVRKHDVNLVTDAMREQALREQFVDKFEVRALPTRELLAAGLEPHEVPAIVVVDVEGLDDLIVRDLVDDDQFKPVVLIFEDYHVSEERKAALRRRFVERGFYSCKHGMDAFVRPQPSSESKSASDSDSSSSSSSGVFDAFQIYQVYDVGSSGNAVNDHKRHLQCVEDYANAQGYNLIRHSNMSAIARAHGIDLLHMVKPNAILDTMIRGAHNVVGSGGEHFSRSHSRLHRRRSSSSASSVHRAADGRRTVDWLLYLDFDVCIKDKARRLESVLREALDAVDQAQKARNTAFSARRDCVILAQDSAHTINTGVLFLRNDAVGRQLVEEWRDATRDFGERWAAGGKKGCGMLCDQRAFVELAACLALRSRTAAPLESIDDVAGLTRKAESCRQALLGDHAANICYRDIANALDFPLNSRAFGGLCLVPESVRLNHHDCGQKYRRGDFIMHSHRWID